MRNRRNNNSGDAHVRDLTYKGRTLPLSVNRKGVFYATFAETFIEAPNLDTLIRRVKRAIDQSGRISVPVTVIKQGWEEPPEFHDYRLTGYQVQRRAFYAVDSEGNEEVLCSYDGAICRQMTPEERARYAATWQAKKDAEEAFEALGKELEVDGQELLRQAASALDGTEPAAQEEEADDAV